MVRLITISTIFLLALQSHLSAHEIKIFASRNTFPAEGGKAVVFLSWGHRIPVDDFIDGSALSQFDLVNPQGKNQKLKVEDLSLQANLVELKDPGVHTAVVVKKQSIYTYVFEDNGDRRLKRGTKVTNKGAKIDYATRYVQFGKSYFVVGKPSEKSPPPLGIPFEIIATEGPLAWKANQDIPFRVLLEGKPVSTAEVLARPVGFKPDEAWAFATESNRNGVFQIRPSAAGIWAIKVHHKALASDAEKAEFDLVSFTTTLTMEIQP